MAVVVTHNRRDLLVQAVAAVSGQTRAPDRVLVVDNASTDGTTNVLQNQGETVELVSLARNLGGAGGFAVGIAEALARGADLVWLMDDDTIPEPGALKALLEARQEFPGDQPPAVTASRVLWTDGQDHPMNTPRQKPAVTRAERAAAVQVGCLPIRSASFVSSLVDCAAVRERGLPIADYFLWNDDFEFTTRLLRGRAGLACPASVVTHKTKTAGSTDADPGERFFYEVRNKVWLFSRSPCLAPLERVLYGGSTLRRWAWTLARSRDRPTLWREMRRGLVTAVRSGPRSTEALMADLGRPVGGSVMKEHGGPSPQPSTPVKETEA